MATSSPANPQTPVRVPVSVRIGAREITIGRMAAHDGDPAQLDPAQLGHLFRVAAELVDGNRYDWPRRRWCVGDRVPLPDTAAYGRIVQVDSHTKEYVVDLGTHGLRRVWWGLLDEPDVETDVDGVV